MDALGFALPISLLLMLVQELYIVLQDSVKTIINYVLEKKLFILINQHFHLMREENSQNKFPHMKEFMLKMQTN